MSDFLTAGILAGHLAATALSPPHTIEDCFQHPELHCASGMPHSLLQEPTQPSIGSVGYTHSPK